MLTLMKISIVFHSGYGHTAEQAKAVERGAKSVAGAEVHLIQIGKDATPWDVLKQSDAIIFGSPTYMGGYSAEFKKFADERNDLGEPWSSPGQ
jgi:NAD(P)H dehydrogenase (quinone)